MRNDSISVIACNAKILQLHLLWFAGEETYQAPDPTADVNVQVSPDSNRLQILEPFKKWDGKDLEVCAVLIFSPNLSPTSSTLTLNAEWSLPFRS